jgi:serine/threonine protein kinase
MSKILLVDDDTALRTTVKDWLVFEQYTVEEAADGNQGWQLLSSGHYDLVVLDWDMPGMNGIEVLRKFRETGGMTPVLMLTGHNTAKDKVLGLDLGADDFVTKPFDIEELSARIRSTLRKQAAIPQAPKPLGTGNSDLLNRANLLGTTLASQYEFISVLGEGGTGIVFKAKHPKLDKLVAIKMLLIPGLKEEIRLRFEQEAKLISRLEHPNIAAVYDFGVTERGQSFMIMEYIQGKSVDEVVYQEDYIPTFTALDIARQAASAISHAHNRGILHRDLKPSNIMLKNATDQPPIAKILDFGCGKLKDMAGQEAVALTREGSVFGSPPYMSPEQVRGRPIDERSDIYSVGCVIYEMVTGYAPFLGNNPADTMFMHLEEEVKPLAFVRPDLQFPPELEPLLLTALAKSPSKRWQSMADLQAALEQILSKSTA